METELDPIDQASRARVAGMSYTCLFQKLHFEPLGDSFILANYDAMIARMQEFEAADPSLRSRTYKEIGW